MRNRQPSLKPFPKKLFPKSPAHKKPPPSSLPNVNKNSLFTRAAHLFKSRRRYSTVTCGRQCHIGGATRKVPLRCNDGFLDKSCRARGHWNCLLKIGIRTCVTVRASTGITISAGTGVSTSGACTRTGRNAGAVRRSGK